MNCSNSTHDQPHSFTDDGRKLLTITQKGCLIAVLPELPQKLNNIAPLCFIRPFRHTYCLQQGAANLLSTDFND